MSKCLDGFPVRKKNERMDLSDRAVHLVYGADLSIAHKSDISRPQSLRQVVVFGHAFILEGEQTVFSFPELVRYFLSPTGVGAVSRAKDAYSLSDSPSGQLGQIAIT
jgi:hypothetical protein